MGKDWQALHLQESPSQFLISLLKVFKFSADFSSFGRLFHQTARPESGLFGLIWAKSFGLRKE